MSGIDITTKIGCKNACIYCPQETLIRAYSMRSNIFEMSFNTYKTCLDKVPSEVPIYFAGMCESWLNPECTNMVLYAYKKGHKIYVNTTLVNMNLSDVDLLKTCSFEDFSIHLPSEKGLEKITINDTYLKVLEELAKSNINISYHSHSGMAPLAVRLEIGNNIPIASLHTRAANLKNTSIPLPKRKRGTIGCMRGLDLFELLPNGDVALCCMDYGLKHVLGNLISEEYDSLFHSAEFLKVKKGLKDKSLDILCRYCEGYSCDVDFSAKFYNYYLPHAKDKLKNIRNLEDIFKFVKEYIKFVFGPTRNRH